MNKGTAGSKTEKAANRRILLSIFALIVIVELGWWIAEKIFCEPQEIVNSEGVEEVSSNSFFCRISN